MTVRVMICDDHLIVRQGIRQVLNDAGDIDVIGEAATGPDVLQSLRALHTLGTLPDVVLLDIALPQRDGLDVLRMLGTEFPKLPVLMLSTYPERQYAVRCLKLGAAGYLNKSADAEIMIEAIRKTARRQLFVTPSVAELLASAIGSGADAAPLSARLSHREYQVFRHLASGQSVGEIATLLHLSPNTISTYRSRILEKAGVRNDVELALYAARNEL
ncbi:response regulator [Pandoraea anhela]|uniref:LuxR family transcriptional regulator n=1 Tax=Pandoraea anhela TaxID=2508295 RepID=A0A5E4WE59_9BURK|nr:response regulator transcription factor [Pandoraea anhela]VVE23387.1 LuxR family transcriptional regulator [Pandoraea anhela]